jgi:hypothetical protein
MDILPVFIWAAGSPRIWGKVCRRKLYYPRCIGLLKESVKDLNMYNRIQEINKVSNWKKNNTAYYLKSYVKHETTKRKKP